MYTNVLVMTLKQYLTTTYDEGLNKKTEELQEHKQKAAAAKNQVIFI